MNKISIIGAGSVGSTIAYTLTVMGIASEIVMIDINTAKAEGEALDIIQGTPFCNPCSIYQGSYEDAEGSDIVILTSGIARKPGQTRLELAQTNVNITKSIIPEITKHAPDAIYIIVSNPVDVLTYTFCKLSGIPENRIIGSGTIIDTSRLRAKLSECYNVSQNNVHSYVFGEHGDSSFVPWSLANISGIPMDECGKFFGTPDVNYDEIEDFVRKSGGQVIQRKGATFYAVAISVCHICERILHGIDTAMPVSTMMHGEYGVDDVCLSTLNLVGKMGVRSKVNVPLTEEEQVKLRRSADALKQVINSLEI
ncbi:MAG: L-lactate dehydrogenase [Ruminococcus sp.]|jgi:L-lactate dehydrogenase|nr:L-lactate dehydrogenase [Ruminococcus sp.]